MVQFGTWRDHHHHHHRHHWTARLNSSSLSCTMVSGYFLVYQKPGCELKVRWLQRFLQEWRLGSHSSLRVSIDRNDASICHGMYDQLKRLALGFLALYRCWVRLPGGVVPFCQSLGVRIYRVDWFASWVWVCQMWWRFDAIVSTSTHTSCTMLSVCVSDSFSVNSCLVT